MLLNVKSTDNLVLVSASNSQNVNRVFRRIFVERNVFRTACSKKDLSFSTRKDLFFFVSQRKNAIITRFVKYGGLEQILNFTYENEV